MIQSEQVETAIVDISDVAQSVFLTRQMLKGRGLSVTNQYTVSTVVSELATNISRYGVKGVIKVKLALWKQSARVEIDAIDSGPGIEDLDKAFEENYSSLNSLGLGLAMVKRLTDEVTVETGSNKGTHIKAITVYPLEESV